MQKVKIAIFHSFPDRTGHDRHLVKTIIVEVQSDKRLTAARAAKVLMREVQGFKSRIGLYMHKTDEGWEAMRALEPSEKCDYHYTWEYAVLSEWES